MARAIPAQEGTQALQAWRDGTATGAQVRTAVRFTLQILARHHPGNSVQVRVPPAGVTQAIAGPRHTRGTPPNVIETDPHTWLALATATLGWQAALTGGQVHASGLRADLGDVLPLAL